MPLMRTIAPITVLEELHLYSPLVSLAGHAWLAEEAAV